MPAQRGPNNKAMAERLGRQRRYLQNCLDDPEAPALLAGRGYDADALAAGVALHAAAQTAYGARDTASGGAKKASAALAAADRHARKLVGEIRSTLRAHYHGQPDHLTALGVTRERAAGDRDTFLTESRATLAAVRKEPYADVAAANGLPGRALDAADDAVATLALTAGGHDAAEGGEENSTDTRDAAYGAFQTWMARFRRFARLAFRDHPHVAERVNS